MKHMRFKFMILMFVFFIVPVIASAATNLWETGQTVCTDNTGTVITCEGSGGLNYPGQDADYKAGVAWPSPRFVNNGNGTINDNLTGLQWLQNANCMKTNYSGDDGLAGTHPAETTTDGGVTWTKALDFIAAINAGSKPLCNPSSSSDWRLPNRNELFSLIDSEKMDPQDTACTNAGAPYASAFEGVPVVYLKSVGFTNFDRSDCHGNPPHWTSTTKPDATTSAFTVDFAAGVVEYCPKAAACTSKYRSDTVYPRVWAVRDAPSCTPVTYYQDFDGDGYGNPAISVSQCPPPPSGYVTDNTDCNDTDPKEKPGQIWYKDADNDLYSNGDMAVQCARPSGYKVASELTATTGDCDDSNAAVNPGATEINNNGIDDDCNPATPTATASGNGYNTPSPLFKASLSLNVNAGSLGTSWLKYYYTYSRLSLNSTSITGISASGGTATVTGVGNVNGVPGCTFTATVTDSSPDAMGIIIVPGGSCTRSYTAPVSAVIGTYTVVGQ